MQRTIKQNSMTHMVKKTEFTLSAIIILLFVITSVFTKNFFTSYNLTNLLKQGSIIGVLAIAQTLVIITGGIDISGGAVTGLSCMVLAMLQRDTSIGFYPTLLIAIVVSVAAGFFNGFIIYNFKVPAMIATLGTSTIIRGIIKIISHGLTVSGIDERILNIGDNSLFDVVPYLSIFWISLAIIVMLMLRYSVFGRNLYIMGSNNEVARLSGIKVRKMTYLVYALAGLLYAIAGIMLAARVQSALPTGGEGYDMNAIASAVIGGSSLAGGRGTVSGTMLGTMLMTLINNAGVQFGLNTHVLEITSGVLIIFAVTMDMIKNRKKA